MISKINDIEIDKKPNNMSKKIRRIDHNQIIRHSASKNSSKKHINITGSEEKIPPNRKTIH